MNSTIPSKSEQNFADRAAMHCTDIARRRTKAILNQDISLAKTMDLTLERIRQQAAGEPGSSEAAAWMKATADEARHDSASGFYFPENDILELNVGVPPIVGGEYVSHDGQIEAKLLYHDTLHVSVVDLRRILAEEGFMLIKIGDLPQNIAKLEANQCGQ